MGRTMRWSKALIPTHKEDPSDAETTSHKLMVRAGLVRQLAAGNLFDNTQLGEFFRVFLMYAFIAFSLAIYAIRKRRGEILIGSGNEKAADQAAVDAMRTALNNLEMDGTVVIGEGERDEAPMLYIGEEAGKADTAKSSDES